MITLCPPNKGTFLTLCQISFACLVFIGFSTEPSDMACLSLYQALFFSPILAAYLILFHSLLCLLVSLICLEVCVCEEVNFLSPNPASKGVVTNPIG